MSTQVLAKERPSRMGQRWHSESKPRELVIEDAPVGRFELANFSRELETLQELILNPKVIRIVERFTTPTTAKRKRTRSENSVPPLPPPPISVDVPYQPAILPAAAATAETPSSGTPVNVPEQKSKVRKTVVATHNTKIRRQSTVVTRI